MDSAFDTDMNAAAHWPAAVELAVRVDYPNGPPEHDRLRLDGLPAASAVRVTRPRSIAGPAEPELVRWTDLPGTTLFMRCLNVLAVHLFGSVDMPPRIIGTPLWSALTMDMTVDADDPQALHFEVRTAAAGRAQLCWQLRRDMPLQTVLTVLDNLDADPLRAMLRLAMEHPQPNRDADTSSGNSNSNSSSSGGGGGGGGGSGGLGGGKPPAAPAADGGPAAGAAARPTDEAVRSNGV